MHLPPLNLEPALHCLPPAGDFPGPTSISRGSSVPLSPLVVPALRHGRVFHKIHQPNNVLDLPSATIQKHQLGIQQWDCQGTTVHLPTHSKDTVRIKRRRTAAFPRTPTHFDTATSDIKSSDKIPQSKFLQPVEQRFVQTDVPRWFSSMIYLISGPSIRLCIYFYACCHQPFTSIVHHPSIIGTFSRNYNPPLRLFLCFLILVLPPLHPSHDLPVRSHTHANSSIRLISTRSYRGKPRQSHLNTSSTFPNRLILYQRWICGISWPLLPSLRVLLRPMFDSVHCFFPLSGQCHSGQVLLGPFLGHRFQNANEIGFFVTGKN